jgi:hypothetical protein
MAELTLSLVAHAFDSGDGSFSVHLYNNRAELALELENENSDTTIEAIESGDDPYEHGALQDIEVEIEVSSGIVRLLQPVRFNSEC